MAVAECWVNQGGADMNKRRMIELIVFLLIMLGICVSVMFVDSFADKHEQSPYTVEDFYTIKDVILGRIVLTDDEFERLDIDKNGSIGATDMLECKRLIGGTEEDPQESEKIDAALDWHYIEDVALTAYCPCVSCCGKSDGITATGAQAQQGVTIAVDPDVIPLGAWVEIDSNLYHAEDTGNFSGNVIDVYFDSHEDAWNFGRQVANVRWYE